MPALWKFVDNTDYLKGLMNNRIHLMNNSLTSEIRKEAYFITPQKNGDLHTQIVTRSSGNEATITWEMPYAAYQERGMRADGTHVIKNYTTAGTGPHFAQQSAHTALNSLGRLWARTVMSVPAKKQ